MPDVYRYDTLPDALRTQVAYMWVGTLGGYREMQRYDFSSPPRSNERWETIRDIVVARERGVFSLSGGNDNPFEQCMHCLMHGSTDEALEIIEVAFRLMDHAMTGRERHLEDLKQDPEDAIRELNVRFREHGIGYRYENGLIVRIDSELLHAEATVPALRLLREERFEGALDEFMRAHDHYRKGETKDANVDALNALESTLKTICDRRRWRYPAGGQRRRARQDGHQPRPHPAGATGALRAPPEGDGDRAAAGSAQPRRPRAGLDADTRPRAPLGVRAPPDGLEHRPPHRGLSGAMIRHQRGTCL